MRALTPAHPNQRMVTPGAMEGVRAGSLRAINHVFGLQTYHIGYRNLTSAKHYRHTHLDDDGVASKHSGGQRIQHIVEGVVPGYNGANLRSKPSRLRVEVSHDYK